MSNYFGWNEHKNKILRAIFQCSIELKWIQWIKPSISNCKLQHNLHLMC